MKEIGGYFGLERLISNEFHENLIALNNARNALVYLAIANKINKLYIPYFLCDSVSGVCEREKIDYEYYHIDSEFNPRFNKKLSSNEYLYIVNYYGQISNEMIISYKNQYNNVIIDNVQAFFQKPVKDVDTIYSCRKFVGVPDGAYLSTNSRLDYELQKDISKDRMKHILGRFEGKSASDYYTDFKANDHSFVQLELRKMSDLTHNILGAIDYKTVKKQREENFSVLHSVLGEINKLKPDFVEGPYAYPFYCKNGMEIKKKLAKSKIFVPTLWPNVLELKDSLEKDYAENILPLPCDQRYNEKDMIYMAKEVLVCIN